MSTAVEKGFVLNTKTLTTIIACATIFGFVWKGIGFAQGLDTRLGAAETWITKRELVDEKFLTMIEGVKVQLTEQTIAFHRLEQQLQAVQKDLESNSARP